MNMKATILNALVLGALALSSTAAHAVVDVYLCARQEMMPMPDGTSVAMWGYAQDDDNNLANGCPAAAPGGNSISVPGPAITLPATESALNIHILNDGLSESTSVIIPGQPSTMTPVMSAPDAEGRQRVLSFTTETANGAITTYSWTGMKAGTFAYQSGTHPAVQIQMGLYGVVTKDAAAGQAYSSAGTAYDNELVLVYSEVDPVLHDEIAAGTYGTAPASTSTIDYQASYFLINGADANVNSYAGGTPGQTTLIRMINMGLTTHMPLVHGADLTIIAEDGHEYPYTRDQYSVMVAAGTTKDALFKPTAVGSYAMFDRMLNLTSRRLPPNGPGSGVVPLDQTSGGGDMQSSPGSMLSQVEVGYLTDADTIYDHKDNCTLVANPGQVDTDNDGFGNSCDADLNNDGYTNALDIGIFKAALDAGTIPLVDFNEDGYTNILDIGYFKTMLFKAPGPSGVN